MDWLVIALAGDRVLMILWAAYQGGKAALAASRVESTPDVPLWSGYRPTRASQAVPSFVEVQSDDVVALDYSSGPKRH